MTAPAASQPSSSWAPVDIGEVLDQLAEAPEDLVGAQVDFLEPFDIRCACGELADTLHLLGRDPVTVVPACPSFDPGYYGPIYLERFWAELEDWARHLAAKGKWEPLFHWLLEQGEGGLPALIPRESGHLIAHGGRSIFAAGPAGARGDRQLLVVDAIDRRELYRGLVQLDEPRTRTSLAGLLAQLVPASTPLIPVTREQRFEREAEHRQAWLEWVSDACNAIAAQATPAAAVRVSLADLQGKP